MKCRHFLAKLSDPDFEWEVAKSKPPISNCVYQSKGGGAYLDEPKCGFDLDGKFLTHNWNCELINDLRRLSDEHGQYSFSEDDSLMVIPHKQKPRFLLLSFYKSRGRVNKIFVLDNYRIRIATERDANNFIDSWKLSYQEYDRKWVNE